jgi:hypothetical protein
VIVRIWRFLRTDRRRQCRNDAALAHIGDPASRIVIQTVATGGKWFAATVIRLRERLEPERTKP